MTARVDIVDMLTKGRGKWGDGDTHAAKTEFTAEDREEFASRASDAQLKEIANRPVDDKWVNSPKKVEDMITNFFAKK
jgi:hypothetical protein